MKKFPISLLCGLAAILLTVVLYFTILGNVVLEAIHFISLVAIVLAEGVTTIYAWLAKGRPRNVAAAIVSAFMIPYAILLSGIYIVNFPMGYGTYMGWYFAGLVVVNVIAFVLISFNSAKEEENDNLQNAKENMLMLRKLTKCIMAESAAEPYLAQLRKIEEDLHYTNDCVIVPEDTRIQDMLLHLQTNIADAEFDTKAYLGEIEKVVRQRTIMAKR